MRLSLHNGRWTHVEISVTGGGALSRSCLWVEQRLAEQTESHKSESGTTREHPPYTAEPVSQHIGRKLKHLKSELGEVEP